MNNVFNNNRLLNGQTKFEIYNKNENVINTDFYNANIEFNNYSLQNILNKFINKEKINTSFKNKANYKYQYGKKLKIPYINKEIYNKIQKNILDNINEYFQYFHLNDKRKFKIINNTIINYLENNEYIKIEFIINIYREEKYNGFQIYVLSYYNLC